MRRHTGEKPYQLTARFHICALHLVLIPFLYSNANYRCLTCSKRFSQLSILQSHMASHVDQRCHLCELCGKSFRQKSQMKTHLLRHKGEEVKKYPCEECSMSFLTSSKPVTYYLLHPCDTIRINIQKFVSRRLSAPHSSSYWRKTVNSTILL